MTYRVQFLPRVTVIKAPKQLYALVRIEHVVLLFCRIEVLMDLFGIVPSSLQSSL